MERETMDETMIPAGDLVKAVDGDLNEATAYPFWFIAVRGLNGRNVILAGVWFSRQSATEHLKAKSYRYSKSAFVYCASGNDSYDWRTLLDSVRSAVAASKADGS